MGQSATAFELNTRCGDWPCQAVCVQTLYIGNDQSVGLTVLQRELRTARLSDAHVITYRAEERHARLAVHTAREAMVQFLFDTSEYQKKKVKQ